MSTRLSKTQIEEKFRSSPFIAWLQLRVESVDYDQQTLTVTVPMRAEFERSAGGGQWHGGPLASIIDTVGDFALAMMVGAGLPTVNFRVDYLRPAVNTSLRVVARSRRIGRTIGVADVDVFNEQQQLLAIGRASYATGVAQPGVSS